MPGSLAASSRRKHRMSRPLITLLRPFRWIKLPFSLDRKRSRRCSDSTAANRNFPCYFSFHPWILSYQKIFNFENGQILYATLNFPYQILFSSIKLELNNRRFYVSPFPIAFYSIHDYFMKTCTCPAFFSRDANIGIRMQKKKKRRNPLFL